MITEYRLYYHRSNTKVICEYLVFKKPLQICAERIAHNTEDMTEEELLGWAKEGFPRGQGHFFPDPGRTEREREAKAVG